MTHVSLSLSLFSSVWQKLGEGVKGVYISIDVDCLDPAFAPGVSHIEPGGLSFRDVMNILHNLQADVVAADVVEFNPQRDTVDGMTAMVAAKLVRELTAKISRWVLSPRLVVKHLIRYKRRASKLIARKNITISHFFFSKFTGEWSYALPSADRMFCYLLLLFLRDIIAS